MRAGDRSGGFSWLWRQRVKLDDALERVKVRIFDDVRASYLLPLTLPGRGR
jgi:hypothetical protein